MANLARQYCEYFGKATEVWKRYVIREIIVAFDEYRDSVCKKLQDAANSGPNGSTGGGQGIPNQEEMFSGVLENAQQVAEQRIVSALNQTLNQPPALPFPVVSMIANQTVNPLVESATSHDGAGSVHNDDDDSVDVSVKSEVDSGSECECDTDDDDVQVKEEPTEGEAITGRSDEQTDNANSNFNDNRENNGFQNGNSNEVANEQESNAQAMMIDGEETSLSYPNGLNMIAFQYSSPPSSPANSELSINSSELIPSFTDDDQSNMSDDDDESASDDENDHADAENDEPVDNMEIDKSELYDYRQGENESSMIDEENSGEESDHLEEQVNMSDVEYDDEDENEEDDDYLMSDDDSTDETTDSEDEQAAGPSTSNGRRSNRQVSKAQTVPNRPSRRPIKVRIITKKLNCTVPGCKKVLPNKTALDVHLLSAHQLKKHRCLVRDCYGKVSTSFNLPCQLKNHRREVHDKVPRTKKWTCKCSKKFKSNSDLTTHYWLYHELGQFTCSKDGCTFQPATTRIKVQIHQEIHREGNYACTVGVCDRSFKRKSYLKQHLATHSEERPFPCPECDMSFKMKSHRTRHLHIHRNDICYRCTWHQCTFSAMWSTSVIGHIRSVHFELPRTKKQQAEEGIEDDRDARVYVVKD